MKNTRAKWGIYMRQLFVASSANFPMSSMASVAIFYIVDKIVYPSAPHSAGPDSWHWQSFNNCCQIAGEEVSSAANGRPRENLIEV